jgi:hypothetical protein
MNNYWYIATKDNLAKSMKQIYRDPNTPVVEGEKDIRIDGIEVAPGIFQSVEDYEANMRFDEERDNKLQDEKNINTN